MVRVDGLLGTREILRLRGGEEWQNGDSALGPDIAPILCVYPVVATMIDDVEEAVMHRVLLSSVSRMMAWTGGYTVELHGEKSGGINPRVSQRGQKEAGAECPRLRGNRSHCAALTEGKSHEPRSNVGWRESSQGYESVGEAEPKRTGLSSTQPETRHGDAESPSCKSSFHGNHNIFTGSPLFGHGVHQPRRQ